MIPFSVLDLASILEGGDATQAFRQVVESARHAESLGYERYWLAEHHNMTGIASAATAVVIGHVAGATRTIRVGAGGIMLPNHSPLVIAEQFGTLESLYPGRIDLGLGRAPGTGLATARAIRRRHDGVDDSEDAFPRDVIELLTYFRPAEPGQAIRAVPGAGLSVPLWILGSSLYGAHVAAAFGLPFGFASHFAPEMLIPALRAYRQQFRAQGTLERSYAMVAVNVVAADTDEEAAFLFSSLQRRFLDLRKTGDAGPLGPPIEDFEARLSTTERILLNQALSVSAVGSRETVKRTLEQIVAATGADELILAGMIHDPEARLRSLEIAAEIRDEIGHEPAAAPAVTAGDRP